MARPKSTTTKNTTKKATTATTASNAKENGVEVTAPTTTKNVVLKDNAKGTIVSINGLTIKSNSIYKIINKPDSTAPDGFQKLGTTKLPSEGIANTIPCRYVITNKSTGQGVYDTGLYEESPCYATMDINEVRTRVEILNKRIVEPYERKFGKGILHHQNDEFWDNHRINLFDGRFLVTDNCSDLLDLFIALNSYELTPKDKLGSPKFKESQYCVEDKDLVRDIKEERASDIMRAISKFSSLLGSNKSHLINLLRYIGIVGVTSSIDDGTLGSFFYEWIHKTDNNVRKFNDTVAGKNGNTKSVIEMYSLIWQMAKDGHIKKRNGKYEFNGQVLGTDLKMSAKNLMTDRDLAEVRMEIYDFEA